MQPRSPHAFRRTARRGAHVPEEHGAVAESHGPALAGLARTAREEIAAEVHQAVRGEGFREAVGEPSFRDAPEVDRGTRFETRLAITYGEELGQRPRRWRRRRRRRRAEGVIARVARGE